MSIVGAFTPPNKSNQEDEMTTPKIKMMVYITPNLKRELRQAAFDLEQTYSEFISRAITTAIAEHQGKKESGQDA
jgi:hypothetical protein